MYDSKDVARYLRIQHKVLLVWCDEYYEEFGVDDDYDTDIELYNNKAGEKYYMIGGDEISGFGAMLEGRRGKEFTKKLMAGDFYSDIDVFLEDEN